MSEQIQESNTNTSMPWWSRADADEKRPMTPAEAAEWLRLGDLGYKNPEKTIRNMAYNCRIEYTTVCGKLMFLKDHLIRYSQRGNVGGRIRSR